VENVEAVTAGEFLMDRHGLLQLAALNANGDVLNWRTRASMRAPSRRRRSSHAESWPGFETSDAAGRRHLRRAVDGGGDGFDAGVHGAGSALPILVRSRIGGKRAEKTWCAERPRAAAW